jgi:TM2 domain-containing membrane protein YozV
MKPKKDKITALILTFVLGFVGVHRFYLGKIPSGVLYFFTGGVFGIGVFIDFFSLLTMSDQTFDLRYNQVSFAGNYQNTKLNYQQKPLTNIADELLKLSDLLDKGVITFEEFERRKVRLLE